MHQKLSIKVEATFAHAKTQKGSGIMLMSGSFGLVYSSLTISLKSFFLHMR